MNVSGAEFNLKKGSTLTRAEICEEADPQATKEIAEYRREVNQEEVKLEEVNTELNGEEANKLLDLLNEFKDVIARNMRQLGVTNKLEMKIELMSEKPIYYKPYRLAYKEKDMVREIVDELKEADIIEDSTSQYVSPCLLVKKKTGDVRLCIDYRALNKQTVKDHYPLARIDDQLDLLHNKKYFCSLDLRSGYYQIPMERGSRDKTAFITPDGVFQFKRMSFGLCNAPSVFSRLMTLVLGNLKYTTAMSYLDDTIIPSETIEEGLLNLKEVLQALRNSNLTLRLDKCSFFKTKIDYLGFEISAKGIAPGKLKLNSIINFPTPCDVRSVRSFVGLASYFRRFIKGFAIIIRPLTDLLKKGIVFKWGDEQNKAFQLVKEKLSSEPILSIYNPEAKTELHTDASQAGISGVLYQIQKDDRLHPISYFSRKTTPEESRYHSFELEALAIVNSVERFRVYLIGIHFTIKTDCNSLKLLANKRDLNPRIGRWFVRLSEFNYTIEYHSSLANSVADSLSRYPTENSKETELVGLPILHINITTDWIAAMQRTNSEIVEKFEYLERNFKDSENKSDGKFAIYNGRVYRESKGRLRLYVPEELRYELVSEAHKNLNHLGITKTLEKLKETYYFPKMHDFVTKYINRCISCIYHKVPGNLNKTSGYLHPLDKGNTCFHTIHVDHLGPFERTDYDNRYIIGLIDGFSKYTVLKAVPDTSAEESINFFKEFISHYGKPFRVITDRGTSFTAYSFEKFCNDHEILHVKVAAGTPRGNGQIERLNKTILTCLSTSQNCETGEANWDQNLYDIQWSLNTTVHKVTKCSPFQLVFRHRGIGLKDNPLTVEINKLNCERINNVESTVDIEKVTELLEKNKETQAKYYDKNKSLAIKYKLGDLVMVRGQIVSTGDSRKLRPKYRGPYQISSVLNNDRYVVEDIPGEQQSGKPYKNILSNERLKLVSSAEI